MPETDHSSGSEPADNSKVKKSLSEDLKQAYLATEYVVFYDDKPLKFSARDFSPQLRTLLKENGVSSASFITAYNPYSEKLTTVENELRQEDLIQDVFLKWHYLPGEGRDPVGLWEAEPSLFILGISLSEANILANKYRQHAFMFIDKHGRTQLIAGVPHE